MYEAIKSFHKQFLFEPEIINSENFVKKSKFILVGMGGSAHASLLLKTWRPNLDLIIHRNYGLPDISTEELKDRLIILSSYSGNTEEVIKAFHIAKEQNLNMVAISIGGELLSLAKANNVPYIQIPDTNIQPRAALGFSIKALLKSMSEEEELSKISELAGSLNNDQYEEQGKALAQKMKNGIPVIYASDRNFSLAQIWKIKLNETGKIPAFYNIFPELNHNELNSFDIKERTPDIFKKFYFIILKDLSDNERILKRMEVTEKLYKDRNFGVEIIEYKDENIWHKIFSCLLLADWTSYYTATGYDLIPDDAPIVEEFKKLILE